MHRSCIFLALTHRYAALGGDELSISNLQEIGSLIKQHYIDDRYSNQIVDTAYGSGYEGVVVLLPGFAIIW